jgi:hypothetical protein
MYNHHNKIMDHLKPPCFFAGQLLVWWNIPIRNPKVSSTKVHRLWPLSPHLSLHQAPSPRPRGLRIEYIESDVAKHQGTRFTRSPSWIQLGCPSPQTSLLLMFLLVQSCQAGLKEHFFFWFLANKMLHSLVTSSPEVSPNATHWPQDRGARNEMCTAGFRPRQLC